LTKLLRIEFVIIIYKNMTDIQNAFGCWSNVVKKKSKGGKAKVVHVEKEVKPLFPIKQNSKPCDKPTKRPPPKTCWNNWASREDVKKS